MLRSRLSALKVWKRKPFVLFTCFFLLMLLFLLIRLAFPCREYHFTGSGSFFPQDPVGSTTVYEGISLPAGTYRVRLQYWTDTDVAALCNVEDGSVFFGGLQSNGEHLYSGLDETGYDIWLYEGTEDLCVTVDYGGEGLVTTGDLTVEETKAFWTMLLTALLFAAAAVYGGMLYIYYDREYSVSREKKQVFFWLAVISFLASLPYLCGYTLAGADLTYHLQRIEGVKDGLLSGQFPVRLEPRWVYDHGYADAIFYCNSLLYFPALLRILGFPVTASYNAYCIALNIATAWIAYDCFRRIFEKRNIGLVCSALYTLSVVRMYKLAGVGLVGEGSAITFLPLVLYGFYRIFAKDPKEKGYQTSWIPLMFGFAGLIQTHVLTCEITALVTILFCLLCLRRVFQRSTLWELAKGALSAVMISLWFLVPFVDYYLTQAVHIKYVSGRTIQERGLYPIQLAFHFWGVGVKQAIESDGLGPEPIGAGLVLVAALLLFGALRLLGRFQRDAGGRLSFVGRAALIGALLLAMSLRIFPWDRIQFLNPVTASLVSSIQFPYRFLVWGTACLVLVFGYCLWYFEERDRRWYGGLLLAAFLGVTTSSLYLLDYVDYEEGYFELYNEEGMGFGYISGAEYLIEGTDMSRLTFSAAVPGEGVELRDYEKGSLGAAFVCENRTETESYVDVPLLLYKGYRAVDADTGQCLAVTASDNQTVRVVLPANYEGRVQVRFVSPFYWRVSELLALATAAVFAGMGLRKRRKTAS